jgi:hypothetical protein
VRLGLWRGWRQRWQGRKRRLCRLMRIKMRRVKVRIRWKRSSKNKRSKKRRWRRRWASKRRLNGWGGNVVDGACLLRHLN